MCGSLRWEGERTSWDSFWVIWNDKGCSEVGLKYTLLWVCPPHPAHTHKYNNLLICMHVNMPLVSFEMRGNRYHSYETVSSAKALGRFVWAYPSCWWRDSETESELEWMNSGHEGGSKSLNELEFRWDKMGGPSWAKHCNTSVRLQKEGG